MSDFIGYRFDTSITQIMDRLYLGGFKNAEDLRQDNPHTISCIVNCTQEPLNLPSAVSARDYTGFHIIQLDQLDNTPWNSRKVHDALNWMHEHLRYGSTVLVHCHAGMSRSPVLMAGYLYTCGWDFDRALRMIRQCRPWINPHQTTIDSMRTLLGASRLHFAPQPRSL